jgi:hypothetical protein
MEEAMDRVYDFKYDLIKRLIDEYGWYRAPTDEEISLYVKDMVERKESMEMERVEMFIDICFS